MSIKLERVVSYRECLIYQIKLPIGRVESRDTIKTIYLHRRNAYGQQT